MQACTSLQTDNHASTPPLSFLQAGCPSCHPTNSVKAPMASERLLKIEREISPWVWYLPFGPPFTHVLFIVTAGELFAQCPLDGYPSTAMEQVLDSSRYFVIRIQDELGSWFTSSNRQAFHCPKARVYYRRFMQCSRSRGSCKVLKSPKNLEKIRPVEVLKLAIIILVPKSPDLWFAWSWKINLASTLVVMHLLLVWCNNLRK